MKAKRIKKSQEKQDQKPFLEPRLVKLGSLKEVTFDSTGQG